MSESEDEGAFESADEGDSAKTTKNVTEKLEKTSISEKPKPAPKPAARRSASSSPHESPSASPKPKPRVTMKPSVKEEADDGTKQKNAVEMDKNIPVVGGNSKPAESTTDEPKEATMTRSSADDEAESETKPASNNQGNIPVASAEPQKSSGWGGWGSWGSNLITSATSSVTTFTNQVGEGFNTVLETVESSLGTPTPEELAQQNKAARMKEPSGVPNGQSECGSQEEGQEWEEGHHLSSDEEDKKEANSGDEEHNATADKGPNKMTGNGAGGWLSSLGAAASGITSAGASGFGVAASGLTGITKSVQESSKHLVTGGLDVLESIGKKTYDVLAEGDHGLKNTVKKATEKPNLSKLLRDAKDHFELQKTGDEEIDESRQAHFGQLFDEHNGLVHLEALELVSSQSQGKYKTLLGTTPKNKHQVVNKEMDSIESAFEIDVEGSENEDIEDHQFGQLVLGELNSLNLPVTADQLITAQDKARSWIKDWQEELHGGVKTQPLEIHRAAITSLAELTAVSMQQFHKVAQLFQMGPTEPITVYKDKAANLSMLTKVLGAEVDILALKFTSCLNKAAEDAEDADSVNPLITNVYLEATNSKTYIQDAFHLLLPVVQHTALMVSHTEDLYSTKS